MGPVILGVIVALAVAMVVSNPGKEAHAQCLIDHINAEENAILGEHNLLGNMLGNLLTPAIVAKGLDIRNFGVCSVGMMDNGANQDAVTLGVFGKVFYIK